MQEVATKYEYLKSLGDCFYILINEKVIPERVLTHLSIYEYYLQTGETELNISVEFNIDIRTVQRIKKFMREPIRQNNVVE